METVVLHVIVRSVNIGDAECEMREASAAAILFKLAGDGRIRAEGLKQLNGVRPGAYLEQNFPDLIAAEDVFAMDLLKAQALVRADVRLQLTRSYRHSDMVEGEKTWNAGQFIAH